MVAIQKMLQKIPSKNAGAAPFKQPKNVNEKAQCNLNF